MIIKNINLPAVFPPQESMANQILRFMVAMDQLPNLLGDPVPPEDIKLAEKLILEEIAELSTAWATYKSNQNVQTLAHLSQEAIDVCYVILWMLNKLGVPADAVFAEIQAANMAKVGPDGKVTKNEHGKVQKPAGWKPADIQGLLLRAERYQHGHS